MDSSTHPLICLIGQLGNGGTERQLYLFLKSLDRGRWNPLVVVGGDSAGIWRERIEDELNVPVTFLGASSPLVKLLKFRLLVAKREPRAILSWSFYTNAFVVASGKARFIGSLRQQLSAEKAQYGAFRLNRCLNVPRLVVNSTFVKNELIEHGVDSAKISVIFNVFERFSDDVDKEGIRRRHGAPPDRCLVIGVGRDSPTKDFHFFVDAVENAMTMNTNIHAMIVGSGGDAVEAVVERKGLSNRFTLVGEVPDARPFLTAADVFFLSSRQEGMPNVLLEAVDAGCAPLVTRVGGVTDVLGERELGEALTGAAITHGNVEEAAEWLGRMANEPTLRATMSANARERLDLFSAERATAEFEKLIQA